MGKVSKGIKCSVEGCPNEASRSLSADKVKKVSFKTQNTRRAYLCKDHYKQFKKETKKDRMREKWKYMSGGSAPQKIRMPK
jgi:hypothetical protein